MKPNENKLLLSSLCKLVGLKKRNCCFTAKGLLDFGSEAILAFPGRVFWILGTFQVTETIEINN